MSRDVVFYDGVCGLCNGLVQFLLPRDRHDRLRFAALQSEFAAASLARHGVRIDLDTLYVLADHGPGERVLSRSAAALRVLGRLGGGWALAARVLWIVPRPLRDVGYRLVARTRYRIFGKYDVCRLPAPAERAKFLDAGNVA